MSNTSIHRDNSDIIIRGKLYIYNSGYRKLYRQVCIYMYTYGIVKVELYNCNKRNYT